MEESGYLERLVIHWFVEIITISAYSYSFLPSNKSFLLYVDKS